MFKTNEFYDHMSPTWSYMRDAYAGEQTIKQAGERYIWRREGMNDTHFNFLIYNGRYPEITSRVIRQSVDRVLSMDPKSGFSTLAKYSDDPYNLLVWLLTETALVGGATLTLNLNGVKPKIIPFTLENTPNWSNRSIALNDQEIIYDDFGFDDDISDKTMIFHMKDNMCHSSIFVDGDSDEPDFTRSILEWNDRSLPFVPATRMSSITKPLFHGISNLAEHYYNTSAERRYILSLIVPQPVITMPPAEEADAWMRSDLYNAEENLKFGSNMMMILPHGAKLEIVSATVRNVSELRQELSMIKDEMTVQGAKIYLETGARAYTTSADTLKIQTQEEISIFNDTLRQVENGLNNIFNKIGILEQETFEPFEFSKADVSLNNVKLEEIIKSETIIGTDSVAEELKQRGIGEEKINDIVESYLVQNLENY